jgi:hypothetical protein
MKEIEIEIEIGQEEAKGVIIRFALGSIEKFLLSSVLVSSAGGVVVHATVQAWMDAWLGCCVGTRHPDELNDG